MHHDGGFFLRKQICGHKSFIKLKYRSFIYQMGDRYTKICAIIFFIKIYVYNIFP